MFANGKSPINVAKGWKGKAISEQKKVEALKKIIEDLKKLPPKNRIDEDIYEQIAKEYAFVYYLQPINPTFKCVPIYFHLEKNAKEICQILEQNNFRVVTIATDGDNGYDQKAIETFELYNEVHGNGGPNALENALKCIEDFKGTCWIADLLHILKCARARLLTNSICVQYQNFNHAFSIRFLEPILNLGKAISDSTTTGKMRDSYAKELFNITTLMKIVNAGESEASSYFLPYCCF